METFSQVYFRETGTIRLVMLHPVNEGCLDELMRLYQEKANQGIRNWEMDLNKIEFINSQTLGMLVAFNTSVASRGGKLRLCLPKNSKITDLILLTRLDRIIDCVIT